MERLRTIANWTWWTGLIIASISFGLALGPLIGLGIFGLGLATYALVALCI